MINVTINLKISIIINLMRPPSGRRSYFWGQRLGSNPESINTSCHRLTTNATFCCVLVQVVAMDFAYSLITSNLY